MSDRRFLLDTCALVWLATGSEDLSAGARTLIDRADLVSVSAISAWEISLKAARGILELPTPPEQWFPAVLTAHHLSLAPLSVDVLIAASSLPWHHRDPADRFIIATARHLGASVVTADARFRLYDVPVVT